MTETTLTLLQPYLLVPELNICICVYVGEFVGTSIYLTLCTSPLKFTYIYACKYMYLRMFYKHLYKNKRKKQLNLFKTFCYFKFLIGMRCMC